MAWRSNLHHETSGRKTKSLRTSCLRERRGSLYIECAMAITLAAVAVGAATHFLALTLRQRRDAEQTRIATQEAANILERLMATPWNDLTEGTTDVELSPFITETLDEPTIRVLVERLDEPTPIKRLRVQVSWVNRSGQRAGPIELAAWKHGVAP